MLVYSAPKLNTPVPIPKNFHKVFVVWDKDTEDINCGGQRCIDCLECYKPTATQINERLK